MFKVYKVSYLNEHPHLKSTVYCYKSDSRIILKRIHEYELK